MEQTTETIKNITLKLNEQEAKWLKGQVQNTHYATLEDEPSEEREIRMKFWNALEGIKP